jgi:xanthine dehydrogenase small subunit
VQFVVNNVLVNVGPVSPDITLLRYLRGAQNLTGTKEGCASGDCGACTVLVGCDGTNGVVYRSVNSCICPLGSLNNQYVMTVEGLAGDTNSEAVHPVQQAMVDCHGSQCGFCTPGFVMSLAWLHMARTADSNTDVDTSRQAVIDAISGNLCRCTGYRPIIEAGLRSLEKPAQVINIVQEWVPDAPLAGNRVLGSTPVTNDAVVDVDISEGYWQPTTEAELQSLLKEQPDARLVAGGTDLMLESTQLYKTLPKLIDLNRISSLTEINLNEETVELGAAASYSDIEQALKNLSPDLMDLLSRLGSRQIRNRGTMGGNICNASPIADTPPVLLVLDADLVIGNSAGNYRREYLADFYLNYKQTTLAAGEYLARIILKRSALAQPLKLYKISKRYEDDISAVMGAFCWDGEQNIKIAFGGMAAIPQRAALTESFIAQSVWLKNGKADAAILERACDILRSEFSPLSDVRASAEYRMAMACSLLKKACAQFAVQSIGETLAKGVFDHA